MRISLSMLLAIGFLVSFSSGQMENRIEWPDTAQAAVILTYDDGIDTHLDVAIPDLEANGLKGTFFVTASNDSFRQRLPEWRRAAQLGHELGNHTLFHPCIAKTTEEVRDWVTPERDLDNYTVRRILDEIEVADTLLTALDGKSERTYAYTCGDMTAGGESYVEGLRSEFSYARGADGGIVSDPSNLDFLRVPSWGKVGATARELIDYVEEAVSQGGIAVFCFHGVGGDYLEVSRDAHRTLLNYLKENQNRIWVDTFLNVMKYVESQQ